MIQYLAISKESTHRMTLSRNNKQTQQKDNENEKKQ